ncbi:MAG: hypothetical protein ACYDEN_04720 [Acidimicrobiales bacterium]
MFEALSGDLEGSAEALLAPGGGGVLGGGLLPALFGDGSPSVEVVERGPEAPDLLFEPAAFGGDEAPELVFGGCDGGGGGGQAAPGVAAFPPSASSGGVLELAEP